MASPVAKAIAVLCRAGHWEAQSLLLCGWYWPPLLFFLAPSHLHTSRLCQLLGAVKSKWVLGVVFEIWSLVPLSLSPQGELFLDGEQGQPVGWDDAAK